MRILTAGIKSIDKDKFNWIGREQLNKPWFALWGSTEIRINDKSFSSWIDFLNSSGMSERDKYRYGISYTLNKNARIFTVDCLNDYLELLDRYHTAPDFLDKISIDWNKFAHDCHFSKDGYDAFHLTEKAFYELRMLDIKIANNIRLDDFYSYDCESWIIFNLDCINKGSIRNVITNYEPELDY